MDPASPLENPQSPVQTACDYSSTPSLLTWLASSGFVAGSDISRVSMPIPFYLDKTMLDLMVQNEMRRVDLLLQACQADTPLNRFKGLLSYYFSCCMTETFGKKPLYPSPGETIGCKYVAPDGNCTYFFAEQLPGMSPNAANTMWNEEKGLYSFGTIGVREEFWGSSVHAVPKGLRIIRFGEENYSMTPPCVAVRLLRGFTEFVGESIVECKETGLRAAIQFLAKPMVWGETNAVTGTVVDTKTDTTLFELSGTWSGKVWLHRAGHEKECIHAFWEGSCELVPIYNGSYDTRLIWAEVKEAISRSDWSTAASERRLIEEASDAERPPRYFRLDADLGIYVRNDTPTPK
eukprot:GGOE01061801.1.p3 GENE.GGOE01061801.1~~GGOE01061801.1.p3  ORF type:complete len:348 (-),score=108.11 GGOE01061801.1:367-1410(-)